MKNNRLKMALILPGVLLVGAIIWAIKYKIDCDKYYNTPITVNLVEIASVYTPVDLNDTGWTQIIDEQFAKDIEEELQITLPNNDYDKHHLLLSPCRRMIDLTYTFGNMRLKKGSAGVFIGRETLNKEVTPHVCYIYRMNTILIWDASETDVEYHPNIEK